MTAEPDTPPDKRAGELLIRFSGGPFGVWAIQGNF